MVCSQFWLQGNELDLIPFGSTRSSLEPKLKRNGKQVGKKLENRPEKIMENKPKNGNQTVI